jgi:hypothetical protein
MALGELLNCLGDRAAHAHKGTGLKAHVLHLQRSPVCLFGVSKTVAGRSALLVAPK